MAVRAPPAQRDPAQHGYVLVPPDAGIALRAMRRRPHDRLVARQTPDAHVQKARNAASEPERETGKNKKLYKKYFKNGAGSIFTFEIKGDAETAKAELSKLDYIEDISFIKDIEKYAEQSTKYARTSSEREKVAQKVERDSVDIKKAEFMQSKIGEEYEGIISNITQFGVFVELENTVEGLVRFENLGDEYFVYDEEHKQLYGEQSGDVLNIGDKMHIRVIEANKELRRVSFERVK